ncbi:Endonuclease [Quillaja saponaria]|uniref:Aspergillus nuclease S1 n=1 Tax=Quillaja saponaria TaxID=32244 RepID=A0AAD7PUY6_QUISA|nr:Endonuclease [Quillaja saponaria]
MGVCELFWAGITIVLLLLIPKTLGWDVEGHYATCKIAEEFLSKDATAAMKQLLPESAKGELAAVCSWPDDIRRELPWSRELHFADTPDFMCNYEYCRDCHDSAGDKDRCVTGAIYNYTMQLDAAYNQDNKVVTKYNLTEALMFLAHFLGDVHQPLHMGFLGDLGGNRITVQWYDTNANLHKVWDRSIIRSAMETFYASDLAAMIESIKRNITSDDRLFWEHCPNNSIACPNPYASESISLACKYAYPNATQGSNLRDDYFFSRLPIVEKRLAQGGVRLAAILNRIFAPQTKVAQA